MIIVSWTGGSRPAKFSNTSQEEKKIVSIIFKSAMREVKNYWGDYCGLNDSPLDMARVQWRRARYDAHATIRQLSA